MKNSKSKITPFLWFDKQAEEAVNFYTTVFKNSKVGTVTHYDAESSKASGQPEDSVMTVAFKIDGQQFVALNGGPLFKFTEAVSFAVNCETQEELDTLWNALSAHKESEQCGWLKDKFGLSWQIVPADLEEMMSDPERAKRTMHAILQMKKIDIATVRQAAYGNDTSARSQN